MYLTNKYDMPFAHFVGVNHHGPSTILFGAWSIPIRGWRPKLSVVEEEVQREGERGREREREREAFRLRERERERELFELGGKF
jgi:hypothetical protein